MIKVYKLDKKFNKNKRNEIHVLKDISLEFPDTGLVFLLGPSGSGKSTLLNAIGGLDRVDSGSVEINDKSIHKYRFNKWDDLRNEHIGYIFQNYILFPELSVYDNIFFALRLIGVKKAEADERIDYALQAVKMEKFKKRKVKNLSGGQQQRVAIARALVKSPDVIIADEPTGNLDANNTNQIMNIIKKISQNCLVVMVTHETRLAQFYGDRIIEIKDGEIISDYLNTQTGELAGAEDRNIYLQDLSSEALTDDNVSIKYFYQNEKPKLNLNVIFKDNTFYLHTSDTKVQIKLLTKGDEIKVIDGKKAPITKESLEDFNYSLNKVEMSSKSHSVISLKDAIGMSFARLKSLKWFQKLFFMSFCLIAIMLVFSIASFIGTFKFDDHNIIYEDRHQVLISDPAHNIGEVTDEVIDKYLALKGQHGIMEYSTSSYSFKLVYDVFEQVSNGYFSFTGSMASIDRITSKDLIFGVMPTEKEDIIVDKWLIDNLIKSSEIASAGLTKYEDFLNKNYSFGSFTLGKIVGIADTNNPTVYAYNQLKVRLSLNMPSWIQDYYLEKLDYDGTLQPGEVLVNEAIYTGEDTYYIGNKQYTIKGTFTDDKIFIVYNTSDLERLFMKQLLNSSSFYLHSNDKKATNAYFDSLGMYVIDNNLTNRYEYLLQHQNQLISQAIFTVVVLAGSLIFMYFMMRSSLFSRVYEIGVYRALGVTRRDIYKIFACEVTIITIFSSFIGWLLTTFVIQKALPTIKNISMGSVHIYYPMYLAILTLLFIYAINLINGLLPVFTLLRKTPAQILTKYDI